MFKEGDKVNLVHIVQGVFPNGKYKISNGTSHILVDGADLMLSNTQKMSSLEKIILSTLAVCFLMNLSLLVAFALLLFG